MNQKGWTEYSDERLNRGEPIRYNRDREGICKSIDKGAKYLIIDGVEQLYEKEYLQEFCTNLIGRYKNTLVFDLTANDANFGLKDRNVKDSFSCDVEILTRDKTKFIGANSIFFGDGDTQSTDFFLDGNHSCKLSKGKTYGLTITMSSLKFSESFHISVWRRKSKNGYIVASAPNYFKSKSEIREQKGEWEKLVMDIFVPNDLENENMKIYLYNPNEEPVYFDDFRIVRYEEILH